VEVSSGRHLFRGDEGRVVVELCKLSIKVSAVSCATESNACRKTLRPALPELGKLGFRIVSRLMMPATVVKAVLPGVKGYVAWGAGVMKRAFVCGWFDICFCAVLCSYSSSSPSPAESLSAAIRAAAARFTEAPCRESAAQMAAVTPPSCSATAAAGSLASTARAAKCWRAATTLVPSECSAVRSSEAGAAWTLAALRGSPQRKLGVLATSSVDIPASPGSQVLTLAPHSALGSQVLMLATPRPASRQKAAGSWSVDEPHADSAR